MGRGCVFCGRHRPTQALKSDRFLDWNLLVYPGIPLSGNVKHREIPPNFVFLWVFMQGIFDTPCEYAYKDRQPYPNFALHASSTWPFYTQANTLMVPGALFL